MNLRFGLDLASVASVEASMATQGPRYLERIYTAAEITDSGGAMIDARRLAERFAVKEATLKVLPATDQGIDFRAIELVCDPGSGRHTIELHGRAAAIAAESRFTRLVVSITSDDRLAAAAVVAEIDGPDVDEEVSPR